MADTISALERSAVTTIHKFEPEGGGQMAALHAVRYKLAVDASLNAMGIPSKALVAFTDVVKDAKDGWEYTETKMNGFPEAATGDIEKRMKDE